MKVCRRSASGRLLPMTITKTNRLRRRWNVDPFVLCGRMREVASPTRTPTSVWVTLSTGFGGYPCRAGLQAGGYGLQAGRAVRHGGGPGSLLVRYAALRGPGVAAGHGLLPAACCLQSMGITSAGVRFRLTRVPRANTSCGAGASPYAKDTGKIPTARAPLA